MLWKKGGISMKKFIFSFSAFLLGLILKNLYRIRIYDLIEVLIMFFYSFGIKENLRDFCETR